MTFAKGFGFAFLFKKEKVIAEVEANIILPEDISVNFTEIEFPDPEREREDWEWKFKHGLADKLDWLMANDPDGFPTREDAQAYLVERKKVVNGIKEQSTNEANIFKIGDKAVPNQEDDGSR